MLEPDDEFVEHMYIGILGRGSDESGKSFWLSKLASTTDDSIYWDVFNDFLYSQEFKDRMAALQYKWEK